MTVDLNSLSDADLKALASGDLGKMSNDGLKTLAFAGKTQVNEPRSNLEELGRQIGLTARAGISGAAGLPLLFGDALNTAINLPIKGVNAVAGRQVIPELKMASQSAQDLMTQAGLPTPENKQERVVQDVTSGMAGVGGMYKLGRLLPDVLSIGPKAVDITATKGLLTDSPTFQMVGGAAAPMAAGIARENDVGQLGQLAAAMAAGTIAPSGGSTANVLAGAAKRGVSNVVKPFTQEGREVITGNVLRSLATDPERAIQNLGNAVERVPGAQPLTAGTSRDVGLAAAETPIRSLDTSGQFAQRLSLNNQARNILLDRLSGLHGEDKMPGAIAKREQVTAPMRDAAFDKAEWFSGGAVDLVPVESQIKNILTGPTGSQEYVEKAMNWVQGRLKAAGEDPRRLDGVRQDINQYIEGKIAGSQGENFKLASKELTQVRNSLTGQIEDIAPGYSEYLGKYGQMSQPIEQMQKIRDIRNRTAINVEDMNTGYRGIAPVQFGKLMDDVKGDLSKVLSKSQLLQMRKVAEDLDLGAAGTQSGVKPPGSDTFRNMSTANVIGQMVGKQMFGENLPKAVMPLQWLYNGSDDAIRGLLVEAMLDPKLAQRMMMKASVMTVEPISKELQRKALKLGYGPAFGLNPDQTK